MLSQDIAPVTFYRNLTITVREVMFSAYISERKQAEDHHDNLVIALDCDDPGKHQHPLEMSTICSVPHFLRVMEKKALKN